MKYEGIVCPNGNAGHDEHVSIEIPKNSMEKIRKGITRTLSIAFVAMGFSSFVACSGANNVKKDIETLKSETIQRQELGTAEEREIRIKKDYDIVQYNNLLYILNNELEKGEFPETAKELIREAMYNVFTNYGQYGILYDDLPDVENYIKNNIIDVISKKIKDIKMIDVDSKEGQELSDFAPAWIDSDYILTILYKNPEIATEEDRLDDILLLLHELEHGSNTYNFNEEVFDDDDDIRELIMEGKATFHEVFGVPLKTEQQCSWCISDSKEKMSIEYGMSNGIGNAVQVYAYQNFVHILGYETMEKVGDTDGVALIKKELSKKYGEELSQKLWNNLGKWYKNYKKDWKSDETFELAVKLQNNFLECIKQDINGLYNKHQVVSYMEKYRYYKLKSMPQVFDKNIKLRTREIFDIDSADELLINKIEHFNAVEQFSCNEKINRIALKCILYADNQPYSNGTEIEYLPNNIKDTDYYFMEYDVDGKKEAYLVVSYKDKNGYPVKMRFTIDEEDIKKINIGGEPQNDLQEPKDDNER